MEESGGGYFRGANRWDRYSHSHVEVRNPSFGSSVQLAFASSPSLEKRMRRMNMNNSTRQSMLIRNRVFDRRNRREMGWVRLEMREKANSTPEKLLPGALFRPQFEVPIELRHSQVKTKCHKRFEARVV